MRNIFFFSSLYPYETTINTELKVMNEYFDNIYYIPSYSSQQFRESEFPYNVTPINLYAELDKDYKNLLVKYIWQFIPIYISELLKKGNFLSYVLKAKTYSVILLQALQRAEKINAFIRRNNIDVDETLFYDYWFENSTLALAILKKRKGIKHFICRAHGFDVYDERWGNKGKVPFRSIKTKYIDRIYAISEFGRNYIKIKISKQYRFKLHCSYLGIVQEKQKQILKSTRKIQTIVSVSNTQEFKRVHIIPDLLINMKQPVHWVHFGCGVFDKLIKEKIKNLPDYIKVDIKGMQPNETIYDFYENNFVDLFISLSTTEGIPVSMMEAISFGVPIMACNICGIPEIVNSQTGVLFEMEDNIDVLTKTLSEALLKDFNRYEIQEFAKNKFDCIKNYHAFFKDIKQI